MAQRLNRISTRFMQTIRTTCLLGTRYKRLQHRFPIKLGKRSRSHNATSIPLGLGGYIEPICLLCPVRYGRQRNAIVKRLEGTEQGGFVAAGLGAVRFSVNVTSLCEEDEEILALGAIFNKLFEGEYVLLAAVEGS